MLNVGLGLTSGMPRGSSIDPRGEVTVPYVKSPGFWQIGRNCSEPSATIEPASVNEPRPSITLFVSRIFRHEVEQGGEGHVAERILKRLYQGLWKLIGPAGFDVLLARALALARKSHPVLAEISVAAGGELQGLENAALDPAALQDGAVAIVACFIDLLVTLIGAELGLRLVRDVWPGLEEEEK
jgi:hypothetical protein